jgi:hypothetical protein
VRQPAEVFGWNRIKIVHFLKWSSQILADQLGHQLGVNLVVYTISHLTQRLESVNLLEQSLASTAVNGLSFSFLDTRTFESNHPCGAAQRRDARLRSSGLRARAK